VLTGGWWGEGYSSAGVVKIVFVHRTSYVYTVHGEGL
jgi:hypothetical protein